MAIHDHNFPDWLEPDYRAIPDLARRWAAYREGPFVGQCADTIHFDAKCQSDKIKALGIKNPRRINELRDIMWACASVIDFANGEEGFEGAIDQLDECFWPDEPGARDEDNRSLATWIMDRRHGE